MAELEAMNEMTTTLLSAWPDGSREDGRGQKKRQCPVGGGPRAGEVGGPPHAQVWSWFRHGPPTSRSWNVDFPVVFPKQYFRGSPASEKDGTGGKGMGRCGRAACLLGPLREPMGHRLREAEHRNYGLSLRQLKRL